MPKPTVTPEVSPTSSSPKYKAVPMPDGAYAIDIYQQTTPGMLRALKQATYGNNPIVAIGRTLETVRAGEPDEIMAAGFGFYTYGEARIESVRNPSADFGHRDATIQLALLQRIGMLGMHTHWLDVEQIDAAHPFPNAQGVRDYVDTWRATMQDSAATASMCGLYGPLSSYHVSVPVATATATNMCGLYVGWGIPLGLDLYEDLTVTAYWASSPSLLQSRANKRGYGLVQVKESFSLAGYVVDVDQHHVDAMGQSILMTVAA